MSLKLKESILKALQAGGSRPLSPTTIFNPTPTPTLDIEAYSLSVNSVPVTTAEIQFPEGRILVSPTPNVNNQYAYGTIVTLTGITDSGYVFMGWIGSCFGGNFLVAIRCQILMDKHKSLQTDFQVASPDIWYIPTPTPTATPTAAHAPAPADPAPAPTATPSPS
ncbi:hypothetical protein M1N24_01095 [Dehalococcoidia bacterium]|nr:hypothetical protein [Dehalococcoidia bacterium]